MAKVTWVGEDILHNRYDDKGNLIEEGVGPSAVIWNGKKFPKGEPVEVTHPEALKRAKRSIYFKVEDDEPRRGPGRPPKAKADEPKEVVTDGADANS